MKIFKSLAIVSAFMGVAALAGCSHTSMKSPDVTAQVRQSLDQNGLKNVSVSQDRDKGVVTLTGNVSTDAERSEAESLTRSIAGTQVVSNQIGVLPVGAESTAKDVNSALDDGIEKNLKAVLIQHRLNKEVRYDVTNGVVTLKGSTNSRSRRAEAEQLAKQTPNVKQVVNELQVKNEKASSSSGLAN